MVRLFSPWLWIHRQLTSRYLVLAHEPLRVSLEDLHSAESKGKWWLVGAAWGGDPLVDAQASSNVPANETALETDADALSENALLKLARKQGMNTDVRRGIFVVLMSSDVRATLSSSLPPRH